MSSFQILISCFVAASTSWSPWMSSTRLHSDIRLKGPYDIALNKRADGTYGGGSAIIAAQGIKTITMAAWLNEQIT